MQKRQRILHKSLIIVLFIAFLLSLCMFGGNGVAVVHAVSSVYSDVMYDLGKDARFNPDDYPAISDDYSVQVIQIAESTNGELFVYVYQPSAMTKPLTATSLSMSTAKDSITPHVYGLTLLSYYDVFAKYVVNDFTVKSESERVYDIIELWRPWDKTIDSESGNDNVISEIAQAVGKTYYATGSGDIITYDCQVMETIEVTSKWCGSIRYSNGFKLYWSSCDSWFIAFSTDRLMEKLLEADVYYVSEDIVAVNGSVGSGKNRQEKYVSLTYTDSVSNPADGWFAKKYTWNRIESVSDFIANESLSPDTVSNLQGKEWVLRFCETDYNRYVNGMGVGATTEEYTSILDVTILRLKFETKGVTYNLGVVDNKTTPDTVPDNMNEGRNSFGFWEWLAELLDVPVWAAKVIFVIVCIVFGPLILALLMLLLSLFFPVLRVVLAAIFKAIGVGLLWLLKGLWWLVCLPFRGIAVLIKKIRGG